MGARARGCATSASPDASLTAHRRCQVLLDTPTGIYATFVMRVVAEEDSSRAVWPSCPARGWSKGVDRLTSRPVCGGGEAGTAGRCDDLVPHPLSVREIEHHGPATER